jgi:hypothetical protein
MYWTFKKNMCTPISGLKTFSTSYELNNFLLHMKQKRFYKKDFVYKTENCYIYWRVPERDGGNNEALLTKTPHNTTLFLQSSLNT